MPNKNLSIQMKIRCMYIEYMFLVHSIFVWVYVFIHLVCSAALKLYGTDLASVHGLAGRYEGFGTARSEFPVAETGYINSLWRSVSMEH